MSSQTVYVVEPSRPLLHHPGIGPLSANFLNSGLALVSEGRNYAISTCTANLIFSSLNFIGTVGQHQNTFTGAYSHRKRDPEDAINEYYSGLLTKQEVLGKEFEKVLHDNLWDLYEP